MSVELPWAEVCGSDRGYQRHRYWGSPPCEACTAAHALYERRRRKAAPARPRELMPCGTSASYRRHIRRGEIACGPCLSAHAAEVARYPKKRVA